ncbi:Chromatin-remodeling ATPase INO80 [Labeo rohita]|uniref:Chromatin-remodeling ATPase INO80 n=1 Tax=Labeo rohita TaxID=84645 RepID=A0ABQ8MAA3_LABRO|nr:Chromatin-remodeling ATPase INO80 [Labeo rohita]
MPEHTLTESQSPAIGPELSPERASLPELISEEVHKYPPSHLLLPPPPLSGIPSAHPQPSICAVGSPRVCQSPSALRPEDPYSSPPAPESRTLPQPVSSTMAPSYLLSAVESTGSTRLPRPSGSALGCCRPYYASGLHSSGYASSLRPYSSVRLLHLSGSILVLCRSGSTTASWIHTSASVARAICSTSYLPILLVTLAHRLSVSASSSSVTCSAAVGRPLGVINPSSSMAPPSVGSTVGRHHGCGLGPTSRSLMAPSGLPWSLLSSPWLLAMSSPPTLFVVLLLSLLLSFYLCLPLLLLLLFTAREMICQDYRPVLSCFAPVSVPLLPYSVIFLSLFS